MRLINIMFVTRCEPTFSLNLRVWHCPRYIAVTSVTHTEGSVMSEVQNVTFMFSSNKISEVSLTLRLGGTLEESRNHLRDVECLLVDTIVHFL